MVSDLGYLGLQSCCRFSGKELVIWQSLALMKIKVRREEERFLQESLLAIEGDNNGSSVYKPSKFVPRQKESQP
jgi:hypothetical protein